MAHSAAWQAGGVAPARHRSAGGAAAVVLVPLPRLLRAAAPMTPACLACVNAAPWMRRPLQRCAAEPQGAPPGSEPRAAAPGAGAASPPTADAGGAAAAAGWAWASALSRRVNLDLALAEAAGAALEGCGEAEPDIAFVFASSGYGQALDLLVPMLRRLVPTARAIVGCTGYGVAGARAGGGSGDGGEEGRPEEVEHAPAVAIALGALPGVTLSLRHVRGSDVPDGGWCWEGFALDCGLDCG
jgi:hypothetical protein